MHQGSLSSYQLIAGVVKLALQRLILNILGLVGQETNQGHNVGVCVTREKRNLHNPLNDTTENLFDAEI